MKPLLQLCPPLAGALLAALLCAQTLAQTSPARGPLPAIAADMPLDDYLGLLRQISPAAEDGARQYLAAMHLRCGTPLGTAALRRALGDAGGDPQLMGLIRAIHLHDTEQRARLLRQIHCPAGRTP